MPSGRGLLKCKSIWKAFSQSQALGKSRQVPSFGRATGIFSFWLYLLGSPNGKKLPFSANQQTSCHMLQLSLIGNFGSVSNQDPRASVVGGNYLAGHTGGWWDSRHFWTKLKVQEDMWSRGKCQGGVSLPPSNICPQRICSFFPPGQRIRRMNLSFSWMDIFYGWLGFFSSQY